VTNDFVPAALMRTACDSFVLCARLLARTAIRELLPSASMRAAIATPREILLYALTLVSRCSGSHA